MNGNACAALIVMAACWSSPSSLAQARPDGRETKSGLPLARAHAHNDYEHPRPLLDALDHGFCSVEADIWLVDGKLLVAHDRNRVSPARTLEALYLDPLRDRTRSHGGRVHPGGPPFTLLVDVKSEAASTYAVLRAVLEGYAGMLTEFRADGTRAKGVTILVSGNRARQTMASEAVRLAAYDGRLADLESSDPPHFVPLISDNWRHHFQWLGSGPMPGEQRLKLNRLVERAHEQGRKVRFWATPDTPAVWKELWEAGVDLINTDDLDGLRRFLVQRAEGGAGGRR